MSLVLYSFMNYEYRRIQKKVCYFELFSKEHFGLEEELKRNGHGFVDSGCCSPAPTW